MGMYDTINYEQVKCFDWVYYHYDEIIKNKLNYVGGSLKYYKDGNKVPYKSLLYNYGKNFMILDVRPEYDADLEEANIEDIIDGTYEEDKSKIKFCIHVIRDGKVKASYYADQEIKEDFSINDCVISYGGTYLNIHSLEDVFNYVKEQKEHIENIETIRTKSNEYFKESMSCFHGLGLIDHDSYEYKMRTQKIEELNKKMKEAQAEEQDALDTEQNSFFKRWGVENKYELEEELGAFLFILIDNADSKRESKRYTEEQIEDVHNIIKKIIQKDPNIIEKFFSWNKTSKKQKNQILNLLTFLS